ncbi:MAG: hypothetical protein M3463_19490 [Verrucomicrobiota bacterium]|nr:hypothetical protein [Verrucomicrobiota bacterium]
MIALGAAIFTFFSQRELANKPLAPAEPVARPNVPSSPETRRTFEPALAPPLRTGASETATLFEPPPDAASVRGAGYIWGSSLKETFAAATRNPDGTKHLDLTDLVKSFKGVARPVDLASAFASPQLRAEYLAAAMTSALDLPTVEQPLIANLLRDFYAADYALRDSAEAVRSEQRSKLCRQARSRLAALLPAETLRGFSELFGSPNLLFETMSVTADSMALRSTSSSGSSTSAASGNDLKISIQANGGVSVRGRHVTTIKDEQVK